MTQNAIMLKKMIKDVEAIRGCCRAGADRTEREKQHMEDYLGVGPLPVQPSAIISAESPPIHRFGHGDPAGSRLSGDT
jgi:hypothetical protein